MPERKLTTRLAVAGALAVLAALVLLPPSRAAGDWIDNDGDGHDSRSGRLRSA